MRELAPPFSKMRRLAAVDRIAHWRLEETSGATVVDDAGASNLTSVVGGANIVDGEFNGEANNRARTFAANQYATGASTPAQRAAMAADWTMEAWIRPTSVAGVNAIIGHGSNAGGEANNYLASIRLDGASLGTQWQRTSSKTVVSTTTTTSPIVLNTRQHVAARCRVTGATREVSLFHNGVLLDVIAGLDPPTGGASGSWELGALPVSHGSPFDGEIYEVRVSSVALDDDAIRDSWARGVRDYDIATLYASGHYEVYGRALLHDGATTWIDLSDWWGLDWLEAIEWETNAEDQGSSGSLTLRREVYDLSLVPTRSASPTNALAPLGEALRLMAGVRLEVAVVPLGTGRDGVTLADWLPAFRGCIVAVDAAADPVKVELFDESTTLQDTWVEPDRSTSPPRDRQYGTDAGTPSEPELQRLIDDNVPPVVGYIGGTPNIYTPTLSGVMMRTAPVTSSKNVLSALEDFVSQWGWDLRYLWDDRRQQHRLTYAEPPRGATWTTGSPTITADLLLERTRLETRRDDIRNVIEVEYGPEDPDHLGTIKRSTVVVENAASIARFGRRYARLGLASASQLNDLVGATKLGNAVLSDLAWPIADAQTALLFDHRYELHDVVRHLADNVHFDTDVDLATVGVRHRIARGEARTTLTQRGSVPSGKRFKWVDLISMPLASTTPPRTPTGVVVSALPGGARFKWDLLQYRGNRRFRETEIHWSTTSGFTPSGATMRERQRGASALSIGGGMTPGVPHYVRLAHVDEMGNVSDYSPQVTVTPRQLPITAHARVRRSTNQILAVSATPTTIVWNAEDADPLARHSTVTGTYTSLHDGTLRVRPRALYDSNAKPSTAARLTIYVNGVLVATGDVGTTNAGAAPNRVQLPPMDEELVVSVGDLVTVRVVAAGGNVGQFIVGGTTSECWFTPITED